MKSTMIVVADSTRARIFKWASDDHKELKELEDMVHTEGRLHEGDMTSDSSGKDNGPAGSGGHAYESKVNPKKQQQLEFAKQVSDYLDAARKANKLLKLLLIVAPEFLGELRSQFSNELGKLVVYESPKNIAGMDRSDIQKQLPKPSEYRQVS